jgi:UDP-glucose 4-epimerase
MWLLTGGAGYIGGHVSRALLAAGQQVVILDDLSTGDRATVPPGVALVAGSVTNPVAVDAVLRDHPVTGVIHLAGKKSSVESIYDPLRYYDENVTGLLTVLGAMERHRVRRLVYSSSAAVYGTSSTEPIGEQSVLDPQTPYARSKLIGEWAVRDLVASTGLSAVVLRYFNVVGCGEAALEDRFGSNLFPSVLGAMSRGERPVIFGYDYPTPDGTCVRDYVHVLDVAQAHVRAAMFTERPRTHTLLNIGCGRGSSVLEVIRAFEQVSGLAIKPVLGPRRPGDSESITADNTAAQRVLGWQPEHDLGAMVGSAWDAAAARVLAALRPDQPSAHPRAVPGRRPRDARLAI